MPRHKLIKKTDRIIEHHTKERLVKYKCGGAPGLDKCEGIWKDPSGDGHGGLNGGAWVSCSVCGGSGEFYSWERC